MLFGRRCKGATIKNQPAQFLKVIAQVLPKNMNLHVNPYNHMTDEQIMERLRAIEEQDGPLLVRHGLTKAGVTEEVF